jgi:two-component system nitrate/nitrite response regulator NarL
VPEAMRVTSVATISRCKRGTGSSNHPFTVESTRPFRMSGANCAMVLQQLTGIAPNGTLRGEGCEMRGGATRRVTVIAADPQPLYRDAVARAIRQRSRLELVGEVADGRAALEQIVRRRPDVAVLDVGMPSLDGQRILDAVTRDRIPTRILFLSADVSSDRAYRAVAGGAAGWLTKATDADGLCAAIVAAAGGDVVLAPEVQTRLARELRSRSRETRPLLSGREQQILRRLADGLTVPEIARELHLGAATVKTHVAHLYDKLEVSERAAAVAQAMRRGLLE